MKKAVCLGVAAVSIFLSGVAARAQSTNQSFPTPVSSNEISGAIRARDLGDARQTSYFYVFNGDQGDIFINVVTKNLDGDIDIFTADNLRPLTKIRVYSDNPEGETGRVIYLRQPQKLILRVEGRTPTDEPATFRIKFAGSFQAMAGTPEIDEKEPEVAKREDSDVRVNSVGTIIGVKPKAVPTPKPSTAKVAAEEDSRQPDEKNETTETRTAEKDDREPEDKEAKKPAVVVTDSKRAKKDETVEKRDEKVAEKETPEENNSTAENRVKPQKPRTARTEKKSEIAPVKPSELVNIRLIVDFKDGRKIERPMSEILKFGVDKGILTIIAKDGSIGRYSILDITKITVE